MKKIFAPAGLIAALLLAVPANAAWHKASSDHFVIYADDDPKDLREFSLRLERYDSALNAQMNLDRPKPSPSNRVNVYVVRNEREVRRLFGDKADRYLGGFYVPRAGGSFAIIPRLDNQGSEVSESERTLFHEYAHHFMYGSSSVAVPRWLSEGFAEFYSTAKFDKDGSIGLGLPAAHRGMELAYAINVPLERLVDTQAYLAKKSKDYDEFYGKSWALFHYLRFAPERAGQMDKYLSLIFSGTKEIDAARQAFGDLKAMEKDLDKYIHKSRLSYFKVSPSVLKTGDIAVTPLDPGEAAIMPLLIRSKRGVSDEQAKELVPEVRAVAAQYPANATVLSELAEAEFDAENDAAAIAAADRAISLAPDNVNALLQKAYAMARQAQNSDGSDPKIWSKVRAQFVKVNKVENDHPIPLVRYYMTYLENGDEPPELAVLGLERALELAPFDEGVRMMVAQQQIGDGRPEAAIATLRPLAYSPHESGLTEAALKMIEDAKAKIGAGDKDPASGETPPSDTADKKE